MDWILSLLLLVYGLSGASGDSAADPTIWQAKAHEVSKQLTQAKHAGDPASNPEAEPAPAEHVEFVKSDPQPDAPKIKGIYVTAHSAGGSRLETLLKLLKETGLNSMVIDVKDDFGYITYPTENPKLLELGTAKRYIADISGLMAKLRAQEVYPIARIVVFKDTVLAHNHPELSFTKGGGNVWKNGRDESFVNPYRKEVWDYNIAIAKEAAALGFKEIQFDYVRFPEGFENKADYLTYHRTEESRVDIVAGFVKYAKEQLEPLGIRVSVDIFGYAASVPAAEGIGQDFVKISKYVDVISPMVYPSHYSTGWFDVESPDKDPYATISGAMKDTHEKVDPLGSHKPVIRPWIQDFTASWLGRGNYVKYGKAEVEAQIKALQDTGIDEYLLWNAGNTYTDGVDHQ